MNAYELADILQEYYDDFDGSFPALEKSIVMLRQQADRIAELEKVIFDRNVDLAKTINRIAELEKENSELKYEKSSGAYQGKYLEQYWVKQQSAEPVAWMEYIQGEEWEVWYVEPKDLPEGHTYKPLYTSPQIKELSDEEIDEVLYSMDWAHDPVKFARAILKKASEK